MKRPTKTTFWILCYAGFLDWMSYGLVFPIFAAMIYDHGGAFLNLDPDTSRGLWLGILVAASPLAQFFSSPIIGSLSDRMGRKPLLQISSLIMVGGYALSALGVWERQLSLLILGRVVTGIGAGNIVVINSAASDVSDQTSKSKNFALIMMANGIGLAIGPLIGGQLALKGFDVPFIASGCFTLLNFFLLTFLFSETLNKKTHKYLTFLPQFYRLLKETPLHKLRILFPAFFIFCIGWSFYWEFIPVTWIRDYELNASHIGYFYAYGSACYVLSSGVLIRPILKRFKGLPILFASLIALSIALALLIHRELILFWFCIPIQQFLVAMIFPVGTAIVSNLALPNKQGETLGAFQSLQSLAFSVTPFLGGSFLDLNKNMPLIFSSIAIFIAGFYLLVGYGRKLFTRGGR